MNFLQHLLESALGQHPASLGQAAKSVVPTALQEHRMLPNDAKPMPHLAPRLAENLQARMPIWNSPNLDTGGQEMQGGQFNPGYTPLQNSGFGQNVQQPVQTNWQNTDGQLRNMVNPQVKDTGYSWNNY